MLVANNIVKNNVTEYKTKTKNTAKPKQKRIRVNDKTATGGWF